MRLNIKKLGSAMAATAVLVALPATGARADTTTTLRHLNGFDRIVVDDSAGHVFLSQGNNGKGIVVTDLSGAYQTTLDTGDFVYGLALSSGGGTLYAAVGGGTDAGDVAKISTSTFSQTRYLLGSGYLPRSLALQSGKLWVSYHSGTAATGAIGAIDPGTGTFTASAVSGAWSDFTDLAADPRDTGILVAWTEGGSASAATFDVATTPATRLDEAALQGAGSSGCALWDLAVVPGGKQFIAPCGSAGASVYSTADLSPQGSYPDTKYPDAVAIAANGTVATGGGDSSDPSVYVTSPDASSPLNTLHYSFPSGQPGGLNERGLAWSADGSTLYAVTSLGTSDNYLNVYKHPALPQAALNLVGTSVAWIGHSIPLAGSLSLASGAPAAGASVAVTRTAADGTVTTLPTETTDSSGDFTVTDTPPATGTYTYTATSAAAPATAIHVVTVARVKSKLTLSAPDKVVIGKRYTVTGKLSLKAGTPPTGTVVTVTRTKPGAKTAHWTEKTSAGGTFTLSNKPPTTGTYTYTARYAGDATTQPARITRKLTVSKWAVPITSPLPHLAGFDKMVVDSRAGHIFLSQGTAGAGIIVTNLSGAYQTTLVPRDNVDGMALSSDGGALYAAVVGGTDVGTIAKISVSSLTSPPAFYPLADQVPYTLVPHSLAVQSGKLWVSYNDTAGNGLQGYVTNFGISAAGFGPGEGMQSPNFSWQSAPEIAGDPDNTGIIVVALPGSTEAVTYNVAGSSAILLAQTANLGQVENCGLTDSAVAPGGQIFVPSCIGVQLEYSTASLRAVGTYEIAGSAVPDAVAIAPNGTFAEGSAYTSGPSIFMYRPGGGNPVHKIQLTPPDIVAGHGLAFSADGSKLYAVMKGAGVKSYFLYIYPALTQSALTLKAPGKAVIGKQYTVSGKLALSTGTPPTGTVVTVTRSRPGTTATHWTEKTSANGTFTLWNGPPAGTYTYTARYAGDVTTQPATVTARLTVTKRTVPLRITTSRNRVPYKGKVKITAHLGATYSNRTVAIYARTVGGKKRVRLKHGRVSSRGNLTVWHQAAHSTVYSAVFAGDLRYRARAVSRTVGVHVRVGAKYTGYYTSTRAGGRKYYVFRRTAKLKAAIKVTPNKHGQCIRLQTQEFSSGSWHNAVSGCGYLNEYSKTSRAWSLSQMNRGYRYRSRIDYRRKSSDHGNLNTAGAWFYFTVRK